MLDIALPGEINVRSSLWEDFAKIQEKREENFIEAPWTGTDDFRLAPGGLNTFSRHRELLVRVGALHAKVHTSDAWIQFLGHQGEGHVADFESVQARAHWVEAAIDVV